jgi:hypothetical protein
MEAGLGAMRSYSYDPFRVLAICSSHWGELKAKALRACSQDLSRHNVRKPAQANCQRKRSDDLDRAVWFL